jgi:hypothetical protein
MTVAAIPNDTVAALVLNADQSWPQEYEKARATYFAPTGGRPPALGGCHEADGELPDPVAR